MDYLDADVPVARSNHERNAKPAAKAAQQRYRQRQRHRAAMNRPFIAWDGEGVTRDDGAHDYVLLASSAGDVISDTYYLPTVTIFETLLSCAATHPDAIHVIYGGGYDINKWLIDVPQILIQALYDSRYVRVGQYILAWRRGKSFYLSDPSTQRSIQVYDVVSFFQSSFVAACDSYLKDRFTDRELIVENKMLRSTFNVNDLDNIMRYNQAELDNLVALCVELRARLDAVNLRPPRWDGPGAIAATLLSREGIRDHLQPVDHPSACPDAARAARIAYAGGRFEVLRFGHVDGPAYEYDINSAYPAAMRTLPSLSMGQWKHSSHDIGDHPFTLYRLHLNARSVDWALPFPLPRRSRMGNICYPQEVIGWYWSPEVAVAREWCAITGATLTVHESWTWQPDTDNKPFAFIESLYRERQALKAAGNGAHVGIKLGLNSLYGKLAQQVGWSRRPNGSLRTPPFHQIEWAGYVTSTTRAQILRASLPALDSIIAYETDAVFTSTPLHVTCGNNLGEWESTVFESLTYLQSGLYFGTLSDGTSVSKTRGIDRGSFTRTEAITNLQQPLARDRIGHAKLTRFIGAGLALAQDWSRWGRWETMPKEIMLTPQGKRTHEYGCPECDPSSIGETLGVWHTTLCPHLGTDPDIITSHEFPVEWINPNPEMVGTILRESASEERAALYGDDYE